MSALNKKVVLFCARKYLDLKTLDNGFVFNKKQFSKIKLKDNPQVFTGEPKIGEEKSPSQKSINAMFRRDEKFLIEYCSNRFQRFGGFVEDNVISKTDMLAYKALVKLGQ